MEARTYQRYCVPFPLQYVIADGKNAISKLAAVCNISESGILIDTEENIQEGVSVKLLMEVGGKKFKLSGKVVRIQSSNHQKHKELAISFTTASDLFKMKMIEQVVRIEEYRLWKSKQMGYPVDEYEAAQEWIERFAKSYSEKI